MNNSFSRIRYALVFACLMAVLLAGCASQSRPASYVTVLYPVARVASDTNTEAASDDQDMIGRFLFKHAELMAGDKLGLWRLNNTQAVRAELFGLLGLLQLKRGVTVNNIVNRNVIFDAEGRPRVYRRKAVKVHAGGRVTVAEDKSTEFVLLYQPGHPDADAEGMVTYPNISLPLEKVDLQITLQECDLIMRLLRRFDPSIVTPLEMSPSPRREYIEAISSGDWE